jgi:hypothetical protein
MTCEAIDAVSGLYHSQSIEDAHNASVTTQIDTYQ